MDFEELRLKVGQAEVDVAYSEAGVDAALDKQVWINSVRSELDMPDDDEVIYVDDDGRRFVQ